MRRRPATAEARARARIRTRAVLLVAALALAPAPGAGQEGRAAGGAETAGIPPAGTPADARVPLDGLATGPFAALEMLYERTIFNIDILELLIVVDPETATVLQGLVAAGAPGGDGPGAELAREMVHAVLDAGDVAVRTRFRRGIGLDQFLDGMTQSLEHAVDDGLLAPAEARAIVDENREHFAGLAGRGFREDDTVWYRVRGDSLEMAVQDAAGRILLADTRSGVSRREALLGGYLARGSDFRDKLLASLFRRDG